MAQAPALLGSSWGMKFAPPPNTPVQGCPEPGEPGWVPKWVKPWTALLPAALHSPQIFPSVYCGDPGHGTAVTEPLLLSPAPAMPLWGSGQKPQEWTLPQNRGWGEAFQDPICHPALHPPPPDLRRATSVCSLQIWLKKPTRTGSHWHYQPLDTAPWEQISGHLFGGGSQEPPASRGCQELYIYLAWI